METYTTARHIERPTLARFAATFGFAWLMVGLFTGTLVLVVLVRWLLELLHHWGWGQTAQNRALIGVILLFVIASFMLTRALVRRLFRINSVRVRRGALAALVVPGALALWAWSNPSKMLAGLAGGGVETTLAMAGGPEFEFGAYPDEAKLRELKAEGVRTIVSLQHPAVFVEVGGIKAERDAAAKLGLHFIQAPMLPWVSDNTASLDEIRQIALHGRGKYYVHCGLGRDRVNVARRLIEALQDSTNAKVTNTAGVLAANGFEDRAEPFQRGKLFQLAPQTWLIPYPNMAEMHGFVLQGRPGHVYLMLNPTDTLQARWLADAETALREYAVPFTYVPFAPKDSVRAAAIVAQMKAQRPPVTIIVPGTSWTEPTKDVSSVAAEVVLRGFGAIPDTAHPTLRVPGTATHVVPVAARSGVRATSVSATAKRHSTRRSGARRVR